MRSGIIIFLALSLLAQLGYTVTLWSSPVLRSKAPRPSKIIATAVILALISCWAGLALTFSTHGTRINDVRIPMYFLFLFDHLELDETSALAI